MNKNTFEKIINIILIIGIGLGMAGGIRYMFFPPQDQIGDSSILISCRDKGGVPGWVEWPQGCSLGKCYVEMCSILNSTK